MCLLCFSRCLAVAVSVMSVTHMGRSPLRVGILLICSIFTCLTHNTHALTHILPHPHTQQYTKQHYIPEDQQYPQYYPQQKNQEQQQYQRQTYLPQQQQQERQTYLQQQQRPTYLSKQQQKQQQERPTYSPQQQQNPEEQQQYLADYTPIQSTGYSFLDNPAPTDDYYTNENEEQEALQPAAAEKRSSSKRSWSSSRSSKPYSSVASSSFNSQPWTSRQGQFYEEDITDRLGIPKIHHDPHRSMLEQIVSAVLRNQQATNVLGHWV